MTNINGSTIPVSLVYDERFKTHVNTSYSGIQIPTTIYNKGLLPTVYEFEKNEYNLSIR